MNPDFLRLDELLLKDEATFTADDHKDLERLAPLLADPEYQAYRWAIIAAAAATNH